MRLMFIGDVVGSRGCGFLRQHMASLRRMYSPDVVIINGENSADGNGATPDSLGALLYDCGADAVTLGNHALRRREVYDFLEEHSNVIRPANLHPDAPGRGSCVIDIPGRPPLTVFNLLGNFGMDIACGNAFDAADALLAKAAVGLTFMDFHAEATSEKICMGLYLDGRISAVAGTHTHIQTADERILPKGTGYITDAGMCGSFNSALGVQAQDAIYRFRTGLPVHFSTDTGAVRLSGVLFDLDETTHMTSKAERINIE